MKQLYLGLVYFLILYIGYALPTNAQFVTLPFRFGNQIVDIVDYNNQRFVATATDGIYVSEDKGVSWQRRWLARELDSQTLDGFRTITIKSIAFIGTQFWAMTDWGMYLSKDQGFNWRRINNPYEYISPNPATNTSTYYKIVGQGDKLFVTEQYFDNKQAKYAHRLITSADNGEHWSIATAPPSSSLQINASEQMLLVSTYSTSGAAVFASKDLGKSWQSITENIAFEHLNTISIDGSTILITGVRTIKDQWGSIIPITVLATSLDAGQSWKIKELTAVNFVEYLTPAAIIHKQIFVVAMNNQIAYSTGNGEWQIDSLGLRKPNFTPEGGIAVLNDTVWISYQDKRLQSDQFALKGYLLTRPLNELSPTYISSPSLLRIADNRYRETVILEWQKANTINDQNYYSLERAEGASQNFHSIARLPVSSTSFIDKQAKHGKVYSYRIRTEQHGSTFHSKYTSVVTVAKPDLAVRAAYLNFFEDLHMTSTDSLFARCGSEIVRSTDGGRSWNLLNPCYFSHQRYDPSYGKFTSLSFPNSQVGYAMIGDRSYLSDQHTLLKTIDGGQTWYLQSIKQDLDIFKLVFTDPSTGFALASDASASGFLLYKTINGGKDFTVVMDAPRFTTLQYKNGFLTGKDDKGRISFSADQGLTWSNTNRYTSAAYIFDKKRYVIGYNGGDSTYVRLTADGGKTWQLAEIPLKRYDQIHDIRFIDDQRGFLIVGFSTNNTAYDLENLSGSVYQTSNGGLTWTSARIPDALQGEAAEISLRNNKAYIVYYPSRVRPSTMLGALVMSEDAGKTWQIVSNPHGKKDFVFASISYRNEKEGIVITKSKNSNSLTSQFFHYYTKDGGLTWLRATSNEPDVTWLVRFISNNVGFRVGNNVVYYTTDGSKNWQRAPITKFPFTYIPDRVFYTPNNNGLTHGGNIQFLSASSWIALSDDNKLYMTTDQGNSWRIMNTPTLRYPMFYFLNERTGYITVENKAEGNQLWKTKDSGLTWNKVGPFDESSLFFLTEDIGFGGLKRTTDGGKHWLLQEDLASANRVSVISPDYRFINEEKGYVGSYYTFDKGDHWCKLAYLSEDVNSSDFSFVGPTVYDSQATLLNTNSYTGVKNRIVPTSAPCSPLAIEGDTLVYVDKTSTSTYSLAAFGWEPSIGFNWSIDDGATIRPDFAKSTLNWSEMGNSVRTLSVRAVNDAGESKPTLLKITTKVIVTAVDPTLPSYFKVYPNPAQLLVNIEVSSGLPLPSITWYEVSGKPILIPGNLKTGYDVSAVPAGIYLVRLQTEHHSEMKRIIISR